jgi:hypothetical protein
MENEQENPKEGKKPEDEPLKSEEWLCDFCQNKNIMTNDLKSAFCGNCKK